MILLDANVLLYAANADAPDHDVARDWLEAALNGAEPIGFAWVVLLAFLRIATRPGLFPTPLTSEQAFALVDDWLSAGPATVVHPTARHSAVLRGLLLRAGTAGNLVSDAHLAGVAVEYGATVCSFDRDFGRFDGVKAFVPAAPNRPGDVR